MKPIKASRQDAARLQAQRRQSVVRYFLDQGFGPEKSVRLAAMYLAALRKQDQQERRKATMERRAEAAATQEQIATSPIWTPPTGLLPHERLAARIAEFGRMSSEKAHRKAAETARAHDARTGG